MLIAHTTDLSSDDDVAFVHALALAARSGARLASVHACVGPQPERELPDADVMLRRWSAGAVQYERILHECCDDVTETLLDALSRLAPDLVVAATRARTGLPRLMSGSVAEGLARNLTAPCLLVPIEGTSVVNAESGAVRLTRILVPAGDARDAELGIKAALWFSNLAGVRIPELVLLHAEGARSPLHVDTPGLRVVLRPASESVEEAIVRATEELQPELLVMTTRGHDGVRDVLLGSHTERVLHAARRPLLWVRHAAGVKH